MVSSREAEYQSGRWQARFTDHVAPPGDLLTSVNLSETKNAALRPRDVLALLSESSTSALAGRYHRLAYFIMVHSGFDNVAALLDALADHYTTILIHVDA
jgi:hypothetical protein